MANNPAKNDKAPVHIVFKAYHLGESAHRRPVLIHIIDVQSHAHIGVQIDLPDLGDQAPPSENA
jgi:hypothetical protein